MNRNSFLVAAVLTVAPILGLLAACSSSTPDSGTSQGNCHQGAVLACTCSNGQSGTQTCGSSDPCSCGGDSGSADSGSNTDAGHEGDSGHINDGAPPSQLYADAAEGSFGWPCTPDNTGTNTSPDCTDPTYNLCFVGGQGSWCTKTCTGATAATDRPVPPTEGQCNGKGFCK